MMLREFLQRVFVDIVAITGFPGLVVCLLGMVIFVVLNLNIFPVLSQKRAYRIIQLAIILPVLSIALVVIVWGMVEIVERRRGIEAGLDVQAGERRIDGVILRDGFAYDENGNRAGFVSIVSQDYNWKLGSSTDIELLGGGSAVLKSHLLAPGIYAAILSCDALVAVGMSSYEMVGESLETEVDRGQMRAHIIQTTIKEMIPKSMEYYELNLGKNMIEDKKKSNFQRMIVILGIKKEISGFNVDSILNRNSLRNLNKLNINLAEYSSFVVRPMR